MLSHLEMIARITSGAVLGGIIGYERHRHRRPVGLRTHFIVSMAAATFMVISSQFIYLQHFGKDDLIEVDASRIAASIVSAVGFLAGGAIVRTGVTVQGLTTAAGLWLVTAIGMCTGAGMYIEGITATCLGVIALTVLRRFEYKDDHLQRRRVSVVLGEEAPDGSAVLDALTSLAVTFADVEYEKRLDDDRKRIVVRFDVQFSDKIPIPQLIAQIERVRGVRRVLVQQPT
jgi:putative Mg2+ transporter-C (MgtC) family protein